MGKNVSKSMTVEFEDQQTAHQWARAVANKYHTDPGTVASVMCGLIWGVSTEVCDRFFDHGKPREETRQLNTDATEAWTRWQNGLPADADISFIKEECNFVEGDIIQCGEVTYKVEMNLGYGGYVEEYPVTTKYPVGTFVSWLYKGTRCRRTGHEEADNG